MQFPPWQRPGNSWHSSMSAQGETAHLQPRPSWKTGALVRLSNTWLPCIHVNAHLDSRFSLSMESPALLMFCHNLRAVLKARCVWLQLGDIGKDSFFAEQSDVRSLQWVILSWLTSGYLASWWLTIHLKLFKIILLGLLHTNFFFTRFSLKVNALPR